jgi:hypothetical protein
MVVHSDIDAWTTAGHSPPSAIELRIPGRTVVSPRRQMNAHVIGGGRSGDDTADPAEVVAYQQQRLQQQQHDALAAAMATLERARPAWHKLAACRGWDVDFTSNRPAGGSAVLAVWCMRGPLRLLVVGDRHQ